MQIVFTHSVELYLCTYLSGFPKTFILSVRHSSLTLLCIIMEKIDESYYEETISVVFIRYDKFNCIGI